MKAAVYFGPEDIRCCDISEPEVKRPHEMLVKVNTTSICGSDLHLYRGSLDAIMDRGKSQTGHELVGEVLETGSSVTGFQTGDRVTMAYSCSCGDCFMCVAGQTAHCETTQKGVYGFGVPFGNMNGTHAELMTIPYADAHALKIPASVTDAAAVTLSCNLPSALIANNLADIQPGENVALIGCGPTGLMALDIIMLKKPGKVIALDAVLHRLDYAELKGAVSININEPGWKEQAMSHCEERGFDKIIEVVGSQSSLQLSFDLIRPGGTIAAIGVFCDQEFNLNLADVFLRDISLHMNGFANVQPFMQESLQMIERGIIDPTTLCSHEFSLNQIDEAFMVFNDKKDNAFKLLIYP